MNNDSKVLLWVAGFAVIMVAALIGTFVLMHLLRKTIDPRSFDDEEGHPHDRPPIDRGPN